MADNMWQVEDEVKLEIVGEVLYAIRKATGGGTLTLADGHNRKMTKSQVILVIYQVDCSVIYYAY